MAPTEIAYLLARFGKPVVDDEPARNGTPEFGGPTGETDPMDHILRITAVWGVGGHVIYRHDMFQTGAETSSVRGSGRGVVSSSGIPDPEFSPSHREVLSFLRRRERYMFV